MILRDDVLTRLRQRLLHECQGVEVKRGKMGDLAAAHHEWVDLDRQLKLSCQKIVTILGLLGPMHTGQSMTASGARCLAEFPPPEDLRKTLRLWKAAREYLRMAGESKVGDIQDFLNWIGLEDVTRQAIESALKRHSEVFVVKRKGREKYVALKKPS